MSYGDLTITDARGQIRRVTMAEFTRDRRQCRWCLLYVREGQKHRCPKDGSNSAAVYRGGPK